MEMKGMNTGMVDFGAGPGSQRLASGRMISDGSDMISGKWINRQTGEVVNVRSSVTDDSGNMILLTDKGQLNMNEFSRLYVQASDEMYDLDGHVVDTKPVQADEITFADNDNPLVADPITPGIKGMKQAPQLKNFDLIDKIFKKIDSKPEADLNITWADFPEKELSMLVNYFDVSKEEIAEYIGKYLINEDLLKNALTAFLVSKMGF